MAKAKADAVVAAAVELARAAAVEAAGLDQVGDHLGASVEADRVMTHLFACLHPGYIDWQWAVTLVRASRAKQATVTEVVLLPAAGALLAPPWVPWSARVAPGDVGPGMLMPTPDDDPRLQPGYTAGSDPKTALETVEIQAVVRELGLGRQRVLSPEGRDLAAERWLAATGPDTESARQAPAACSSCGYLIRLRGGLGACFGVCANQYSSFDGRTVSVDSGCGAHSDVVDDHREAQLPPPVWDTLTDDQSLFA